MDNSTDTAIGEDARPGMLLVPIATEAVLPHVVRATEAAGYAGLMVVLARTAEARELHDELTDHWTSLHSVTGSLVAVLCPDPEVLDGPGGTSDKILCCHGLRLRHPVSPPGLRIRFRERFDGTIYESVPNEYHEEWAPFGFRAISQTPQMARLHHDAWTEAASRCAGYFGIGEEHLPSVLLLSLWERAAVLFTARFRSTLFGLCKALAVDLGDAPRRIDRLKTREERLTALLDELTRAGDGQPGVTDARVRHTEATLAEVSQRLDALRGDLHLARAAEAAGCRTLGGAPAPLPGRAALTGWRLRLVADAGQPPLNLRPKRA